MLTSPEATITEIAMNKTMLALGIATFASLALAQPAGPGYGRGPGYGNGPGCGGEPGAGCGAGYAGGASELVTPEERAAFRDDMHAATTVAQCKAIVAEHRQLLESRAKEKGIAAPRGPNDLMCDRMKARGLLD
jgi:Spy/CpxP family protein refolding chaperone